MTSLGLLGANGRMGRQVSALIHTHFSKQAKLIAGVDRDDAPSTLLQSDCVIDFSSPDAMMATAQFAVQQKGKLPAFVVGSTGWKSPARQELAALAGRTPVLISSNFSMGVLALLHILRESSPLLKKLGYVPSILETHHQHKKDSPSGTAIAIQNTISPEKPSSVQTQSMRRGEVIGDHEVTFQGSDDRVTLGHFAQDRAIFARGAIQAALWLVKRGRPGFYEIDDFFEELSHE